MYNLTADKGSPSPTILFQASDVPSPWHIVQKFSQ